MPIDPNVTLPIVLAGLALAGVGAMRLTAGAMPAMPRRVAAAALLAGLGVAVGALVLPVPEAEEAAPAREVPLEPVPDEPAGPADTGTISGAIRTHTDEPVAGTEVALLIFEAGEESGTLEETTGEDGGFRFTDLDIAPDRGYLVQTAYEGAVFGSELLLLGPHAPSLDLDLVVAPPTEDDSGVRVQTDALVIAGDAEGLQVVQILSIVNEADEAYVGALRLPLLPDAVGVDPRQGLDPTRLWPLDGDLVAGSPLPPGETEVVYTYGLPMPEEGLAVERRVRYPTERLELLVGDDLGVDAPALEAGERVRPPFPGGGGSADRSYQRFRSAELRPGDTVAATVALDEGPEPLQVAVIAAAIVAAIALIAFPLVRRRRAAPPPPPAAPHDALSPSSESSESSEGT